MTDRRSPYHLDNNKPLSSSHCSICASLREALFAMCEMILLSWTVYFFIGPFYVAASQSIFLLVPAISVKK